MARKRNPIPKKVAGFKVPKSVRKSKTLRSLLASPMGREIVANALTAGAGAAATVLIAKRDDIEVAAKRGAGKGRNTLGLVGDAVHAGANAIIEVVTDAARSVLPDPPPRRERANARRH